MRFDPDQLETLLVIAEEGTFEAASRRLSLTPSAISQRVRALERAAGTVLLARTTPVSVTEPGRPLVRLARELRLLATEAEAAFLAQAVVELSVAVNADSLVSWWRPVLSDVAARGDVVLRLHVEDQAHSHELLRRGDVLAAVTSQPQPVQGCSVEPLGGLRYTPAAAPHLLEQHRRGRSVDWAAMPMVVFNEKDELQDDVLRSRGSARPRRVHRVPSAADFAEAVRRGLGWGMVLDDQQAGLVRLPGVRPVVVPLFWQRWRLDSDALTALSDDVRHAARALRPPSPTPSAAARD